MKFLGIHLTDGVQNLDCEPTTCCCEVIRELKDGGAAHVRGLENSMRSDIIDTRELGLYD